MELRNHPKSWQSGELVVAFIGPLQFFLCGPDSKVVEHDITLSVAVLDRLDRASLCVYNDLNILLINVVGHDVKVSRREITEGELEILQPNHMKYPTSKNLNSNSNPSSVTKGALKLNSS